MVKINSKTNDHRHRVSVYFTTKRAADSFRGMLDSAGFESTYTLVTSSAMEKFKDAKDGEWHG